MSYRGIVDEDLQEELVDHVCALIEVRMQEGERFIEAYDQVIQSFGKEQGLLDIQAEDIIITNNNTKIMVKNYFKIALRNLIKHKFYSLINIVGLSVGVACSLMILLYVVDELSFDNFHEDGESIYRVIRHGKYGDNEFTFPVAAAPLAPTMLQEIPEIEEAVRFRTYGSYFVKNPYAQESFKEEHIVFVDSGFFRLFSFPIITGNISPLTKPFTMAISEKMANKYFKGQSALNQTLILGETPYAITAVYQDMPENSHLQFDFLLSMASMADEANNGVWLSNNFFTYFKLQPGASVEEVKKKVDAMDMSYTGVQIEQFIGKSMEEFLEGGNYLYSEWQPLDEIYLYSDFIFDIGKTGNGEYIKLFLGIVLMIIVLACINFMNLSTARSSNRAKEVGIRKALGSYKSHLIRQFLLESVIMSAIAFLLGLALVSLLLPLFNDLAGKSLELPANNFFFIITLISASLFIGFLAGLYPAFFLSSFAPIHTLKGKLSLGSRGGALRSGLVVFQFFISILLITATIAINKQLTFMQNKKIGYEKEQVLLIHDTYMLGDQMQPFKEELLQEASIKSASYSAFIPVNGYSRVDNSFWPEGQAPTENNLVSMQLWNVDADYIETMGIRLFAGRNFNRDMKTDSVSIIINEKAMRAFGLSPDSDQNYILSFHFDPETGSSSASEYDKYKIIGYVEDFHYESMKQSIGPLGMKLNQNAGTLSVKLATDNMASSLNQIDETWSRFSENIPLNYSFLDEEFGNMYRSESQLGVVFSVFSGLAIFIGCLGLFGLASFMAEQRTKEIGIRKVLGASVNNILIMLTSQFSRLILIAFLLAVPIAWFAIDQWLSNYTYKTSLGIDIFLLAAAAAFLVAGVTIGYQAIKAARSNPVNSLRSE
jgi:putative ABC transport system permease protein